MESPGSSPIPGNAKLQLGPEWPVRAAAVFGWTLVVGWIRESERLIQKIIIMPIE